MPIEPESAEAPTTASFEVAPHGRALAARALLASPDGSPQRATDLLGWNTQFRDRGANAA